MKFRDWFWLFGLGVLLSSFVVFASMLLYAFPSGVLIVDFSYFGEYYFELFLVLLSVPCVSYFLVDCFNNKGGFS